MGRRRGTLYRHGRGRPTDATHRSQAAHKPRERAAGRVCSVAGRTCPSPRHLAHVLTRRAASLYGSAQGLRNGLTSREQPRDPRERCSRLQGRTHRRWCCKPRLTDTLARSGGPRGPSERASAGGTGRALLVGCVSALRPPLPCSLLVRSAASPRSRDALATAARRLERPCTAPTDDPGEVPGVRCRRNDPPRAYVEEYVDHRGRTSTLVTTPAPDQHEATALRPAAGRPSARGLALPTAARSGRAGSCPSGTVPRLARVGGFGVEKDSQRQRTPHAEAGLTRCPVSPSATSSGDTSALSARQHGSSPCQAGRGTEASPCSGERGGEASRVVSPDVAGEHGRQSAGPSSHAAAGGVSVGGERPERGPLLRRASFSGALRHTESSCGSIRIKASPMQTRRRLAISVE